MEQSQSKLDKILDRMPGWPDERQGVIIGIFILTASMIIMGYTNPSLWEVEVFKMLIQAFGITGLLNLVAGYYFSANKDAQTANTTTLEAIKAVSATSPIMADDVIREGDTITVEKD